MTSSGAVSDQQRRQQFLDDLVAVVRTAGANAAAIAKDGSDDGGGSSKAAAAEVARYALLRVQLTRSEAALNATTADDVTASSAGCRRKRRPAYCTARSMLGLDAMSGWTLLAFATVWLLMHAHRNDHFNLLDHVMDKLQQRCLLSAERSFLAVEMSRSPINCEMCRDMREMPVEHNMTRELFLSRYAYTSRPVLIKNFAKDWKALSNFSLEFFKNLYDAKPESYNTHDGAGQFFAYLTEFGRLREVLHMSDERQKSDWYIGWSNADKEIGKQLKEYYSRPEFLPADAESSRIDWMFMGNAARGAHMHVDNVKRPSWQAQIKGRKIWKVVPSPECLSVCHSFNVTVHPGDIIIIDTNRWYHATYVYPGDFSVTIGSEYD